MLAEIEQLGGGKVIGIERERARAALNRQRVKEFSALFAVAAVAAAFWLIPASSPEPVASAPSSSVPTPLSSTPAPEVGSAVAAVPGPSGSAAVALGAAGGGGGGEVEGPGVDVQTVESELHPFSIFYVPAATGLNAHSPSVVVWIAE